VISRLAAPVPAAFADVASEDIGTSGGPLTKVVVGNDLSCQVAHSGDSAFEFFPSGSAPGDCGTFLATGGSLYTPDFSSHGGTATTSLGERTPFTPVSQSGASGTGSSSSPHRLVTSADAGTTGLRVTQTDSYTSGQEAYRTDVVITNNGGATATGVIYRAADCYLQESDSGFGFSGSPDGSVGCSQNANNTPRGRIEQWVPITGGNTFTEDGYSNVWSKIGAQVPFANDCAQCEAQVDNGSGISWSFSVAPGQSATFSHYTTFSPSGRTGAPLPPPVMGVSANAVPEAGQVFVKLPASAATKAQYRWAHGGASRFIPLSQARQIPIGSTLDTRRGRVLLSTAGAANGTQDGHFSQGLFVLRQSRSNPLTTLTATGRLTGCNTRVPRGGAAKVATEARRRRSLFSRVRGRFRTRGRASSATVRGTTWLQKDTCAGTLTKVTAGSVLVRDFAKRKRVVVRKGHKYFARAPRRR
jgi:hypothetical protein